MDNMETGTKGVEGDASHTPQSDNVQEEVEIFSRTRRKKLVESEQKSLATTAPELADANGGTKNKRNRGRGGKTTVAEIRDKDVQICLLQKALVAARKDRGEEGSSRTRDEDSPRASEKDDGDSARPSKKCPVGRQSGEMQYFADSPRASNEPPRKKMEIDIPDGGQVAKPVFDPAAVIEAFSMLR
eukprot:GEMP01091891.1.p1 GENE.GEMP01091891.1~~GEMP01091891.1.p1  ORF type:complete len:186 (+),score=43.78 GEMP01091891.1:87-644(+)